MRTKAICVFNIFRRNPLRPYGINNNRCNFISTSNTFLAGDIILNRLGCWQDSLFSPIFRYIYLNYSGKMDWRKWPDMNHVVKACARAAAARGYTHFAITNYNQCRWSKNGLREYKRYGTSRLCFYGLGAYYSNYVYAIERSGKSFENIK